jgi:hypothetical protein
MGGRGMNDNYNPKLRACKHEIAGILKKYNVLANIILADGEGIGEFGMFIGEDTADWSTIRFLKGNRVHLKLYAKSDKENTNKTVNALYHFKDILGMLFMQNEEMIKMIEKHFEIEKTGTGTFYEEN